ncbi:hypothetical protein D4764_19G0004570 [Takifugu flavidus]|uniref:Uncharacterized protein n=1 Tax=Takifugu flavidus TaxID=433684 RepID=A0A5C6NPP4_9TELE|nr:hypothetical protein D4764_19G0004570 [Takifugu flavidus]
MDRNAGCSPVPTEIPYDRERERERERESDLIEGRTTESGPPQREPSSSPSHFSEVSLLVKLDIVQKRRHGSNLRQDTGIPASEETVAMVSLRLVGILRICGTPGKILLTCNPAANIFALDNCI